MSWAFCLIHQDWNAVRILPREEVVAAESVIHLKSIQKARVMPVSSFFFSILYLVHHKGDSHWTVTTLNQLNFFELLLAQSYYCLINCWIPLKVFWQLTETANAGRPSVTSKPNSNFDAPTWTSVCFRTGYDVVVVRYKTGSYIMICALHHFFSTYANLKLAKILSHPSCLFSLIQSITQYLRKELRQAKLILSDSCWWKSVKK